MFSTFFISIPPPLEYYNSLIIILGEKINILHMLIM
jgi:hypothetical protein